jgi:hypothetical protein
MRYAKKRDSDVDWTLNLDDERAQERQVRVRRREPASPKMTRKMQKVDARLLAMSRSDYQDPIATVKPPPAPINEEVVLLPKRAVEPPPLPIPFPFPFANGAGSGEMPLVLGPAQDDSFISVHDSWLLPTPPDGSGHMSLRSLLPMMGDNRVIFRSLFPREPEPFTIVPPHFSLPPRS